ncbi:enoyl-CoA hydratase [Desulfatiglans anilini]|uniref:enoyl-CoA hydratase n=1 Tax=Desulfatiglans anilini TaxID=90728 RepID=UPI00040FA541|nr:enoyl-CoA hydratase [Desulfatiglans anilini]
MSYQQITYSVEKNILTITLNRPEKRNAWTWVMANELRDAMLRAERDRDVRVVVLTGAGNAFCSGADLDELKDAGNLLQEVLREDNQDAPEKQVSILMKTKTDEELDPENPSGKRGDFRKRFSYFLGVDKPVIAAVNGPAVGLGFVVGLYCDIRFASDQARFSTAFSRRGLIAEHGISWILPRIAGLANALDLLFSARMIDASEALSMGLVSRVFPQGEFMARVKDYASVLATEVSPRSLGVMKRQVYRAQFQTLAEAWQEADAEMLLSFRSEDAKEGVAHFLEKRAPDFTGR